MYVTSLLTCGFVKKREKAGAGEEKKKGKKEETRNKKGKETKKPLFLSQGSQGWWASDGDQTDCALLSVLLKWQGQRDLNSP